MVDEENASDNRQGIEQSCSSTHPDQGEAMHVVGGGERRGAEVRREDEADANETWSKRGGGGELRELDAEEAANLFPPPLLPFGAMEMYALQEGNAAAPSNPDDFGFGLGDPNISNKPASKSHQHSGSDLDASLREGGVRARFGPQHIVPLGLRESLTGRCTDSAEAEIEMEARAMLAASSEPDPSELQPFISENEDARVGWRWGGGVEEVRRWLRLLCCCVRGAYSPV